MQTEIVPTDNSSTITASDSTLSAFARVVMLAHQRHVALPIHTTLEVIDEPVVSFVPGCAYYGYGLVLWQQVWLPLIHLNVLLEAHNENHETDLSVAPKYVLVVAYQRYPGAAIEQGALALQELPETFAVSNDAVCPLPTYSDLLPELSLSCFRRNGEAIPVLDTQALFSRYQG